jgi:VIT1/CCC1 family predicted Fe2+/Mn2+ transporter
VVASALDSSDLKEIYAAVTQVPVSSTRPGLDTTDWLGAVAVFLFVFASTFPPILPFLFIDDAMVALRLSNFIAVAMMFVLGYVFGQLAGHRPLITAGAMVLIGSAVVALTIALGG